MTTQLPVAPTVIAPDGSNVRILLQLSGGSLAHFELAPGKTSKAVQHRTVEEIWYIIGGQGEMWRKQNDREEIVSLQNGTCLTIPVGTTFQFRTLGHDPLQMVAVTMPPWPGEGEAILLEGHWPIRS